jgi:anti-sigma B factor antagonist
MSDAAHSIEVDTVLVDGRSVTRVRGDVDLHTAPRLRDLLIDLSKRLGGTLLVDLSQVEYMDSSGVGTMVYVKRELEKAGRKLILTGLRPRVRGLFEITHLDAFFHITDSPAAADGP